MSSRVTVNIQFLGMLKNVAEDKDTTLVVDSDIVRAMAEIGQFYDFKAYGYTADTIGLFINGRHMSFLIEQKAVLQNGDNLMFMHSFSGG